MSDIIGRGTIEVTADASKLKAGINDAKKSIKSLGKDVSDSMGTASAAASRSIDRYISKLQDSVKTQGMGARQAELYALSLRGASKAQLEAADAAIRMKEGYEKGVVIGGQLKSMFIGIAAVAAAAGVATVAAFQKINESIANYKGIAEKTGESAQNIASLQRAADTSGTSIDSIANASVKLTAALSKTDDESKIVAKGLSALGLTLADFKKLSPAEQFDALGASFAKFKDGPEKTAAAIAILGKSGAEVLPFLNDLADQGERQITLTNEQIAASDAYDKKLRDLKSTISRTAQVIVAESLPAVVDLTGAFVDVITQTIGANNAASDLGKNGSIADFAESGARSLAGLLDMLNKVVFAFEFAGKTIGASAAIIGATVRGEFSLIGGIVSAAREDGQKMLNQLSYAEALDKRIAARKTAAKNAPAVTADTRPTISTAAFAQGKPKKGGAGKKDNSAAQEAKAQLAFDLSEIRKAQDALSNTISNSEKVMEAKRSAALISEKDYYAQKRNFLIENNRVQEQGAQAEIDRLSREVLTGKDKIDNDRKIADAQAKLNKLRENGAANLEILGIKEKSSLDTIARAFADAEDAAKSYLEVVSRAAQQEIAGIGKGQKARDFAAGISSVEEKFETQRQALQRDNRNGKFAGRPDDYQRELALLNSSQAAEIAIYKAKYNTLEKLQKDWTTGATEALTNYYNDTQDLAKQTQEVFTNAFKGLEDTLVEFSTTGKASFKSLANSIIADISRMVIKQQITGPLANSLSGLIGGSGGGLAGLFGGASSGGGSDVLGAFISGLSGRAIGGPVSANSMYRVNERGPELLRVAGKQYLMTGSQSGSVSPNTSRPGASQSIVNNFTLNTPTDRRTQQQIGREVYVSTKRAAARMG